MDWFRDLKIATKLITGFSLVILFVIIMASVTLIDVQTLLNLQVENAHLSVHVLNADHARRVPYKIIAFIKDGIVTRDIQKTEQYYTEYKKEWSALIDTLRDDAVTDNEKALVEKASDAVNKLCATFEGEMLPLLKQGRSIATGATLLAMDDRLKLDNLIDVTQMPLRSYAKLKNDEMAKANVAFNAEVSYMVIFTIVMVIIIVLLSVIIAGFITKTIKEPILKVMKMGEELKKGHVKARAGVTSKDELGIMSATLDGVAEQLDGLSGVMLEIANGNITNEAKMYDKEDAIAPSLNAIIRSLKMLIGETNLLTGTAINGELSKRGDSQKFMGAYKDVIEGINNILDAVVKPVKEGSDVLEVMATGDMTVRMHGDYKGDYQVIKNSINKLGEQMSRALNDVTEAVHATASASSQISASSEEMAAGAHEQSLQTTEIAGSVEKMTSTILDSSKNANIAADSSKLASDTALNGAKKVEETKTGMLMIVESVQETGKVISSLAKKTEQIGEITQVIDDIADQTNLLALNAAIEAARAGEQGRGFAVVADEVRKLAERTTKATKEIAVTIKLIQGEAKQADDSMDLAGRAVENGMRLTEEVAASLQRILEVNQSVSNIITKVAAASEEQSGASEEISNNIEGISSVIHQSAAGTQQIARAAEDLNKLTLNLQDLVGRFKIDNNNGHHESAGYTNKLIGNKKYQLLHS
ncbi:MAG: methyl-accepting chemotaxis protein [Ignavibacteria bacterium]